MAAIRVDQVKAIAAKLEEIIRSDRDKENQEFYKGSMFKEGYKSFCESDSRAQALIQAHELLKEQNAINPRIISLTVRTDTDLKAPTNYYRTVSVTLGDIDNELDKLYRNSISITNTYKNTTATNLYHELNYKTITSSDLLQIEKDLLDSCLEPEGFSVFINLVTDGE